MQLGREVIYTNYKEVNKENILDILRKAFTKHQVNASKMDFLLNYEAGKVNPVRDKAYRSDIQNFVPDSIANYIVEFKLGFEWGNPITFVQSDDVTSDNNENIAKAISIVNKNYRSAGISSKQQELARNIEICGVGYTYTDVNTEYENGDSYFTQDVLDPRFAFVIRSNAYTDKRIIMAASYIIDEEKTKFFTCFTKNERYEIKNFETIVEVTINPLRRIPIVEWIRSYDRQGCFERLIPMIDSVTACQSAFLDGVQSNTDTVWWGSDVEFPVKTTVNEDGTESEEIIKPKDGDWLLTKTPRDGKTPEVKPLTVDYDYNGQLANISATRAHIYSMAHVPQRNDNSGGSTGIAMDDAAGWTDAEADAKRKQMLSEYSKMEELKIILAIYRISQDVPVDSPLHDLIYSDCATSFKRSKEYELTVKVNAACALISKGFALEDVLTNISMVEDPSQVIARSGDGVRKYQEVNVFNNKENTSDKRPFPDTSDQQTNSPLVGGMSKQDAIEVE